MQASKPASQQASKPASQQASKTHLPVSEAGAAAQHGTAQQQPRQGVTHGLVH
jgi:hypothetical protein